jgi:hypothetical protein
METNFNFKSQPVTSIEQSEKLLALGLNKETADMCWMYGEVLSCNPPELTVDIPAWSLHRLLSLLPQSVKIGKNYYDLAIIQNEFVRLIDEIGDIYIYFDREGIYESLLLCIEWLIKEGYFNKEYLVNQAEIDEHCKGVLEYLDYIREEE